MSVNSASTKLLIQLVADFFHLHDIIFFLFKMQFEKRESPSSVKNAKISEDGVLTFDFTTPLGSIYVRNTAVKAIFRDKKLLVVWLSALTTFWEGEYGEKLNTIKDSFKLVDVVKRA